MSAFPGWSLSSFLLAKGKKKIKNGKESKFLSGLGFLFVCTIHRNDCKIMLLMKITILFHFVVITIFFPWWLFFFFFSAGRNGHFQQYA